MGVLPLEGLSTFPDNRVIRLNNANEGTANEIKVTASVAIPAAAYQVLYILNVTQKNTGPVTIVGAINRDLVTNTHHPIAAGYLTPGMALLCIDTGTELRLLSYGDVESVVEEFASRAEAAEEAAELAKDQAQNAASDAVSQGNVPIYSTRDAVESLEIPAGITAFRTNGFATVGDGGAALYKRVPSEPSHAGKVQSADDTWWELAETNFHVAMFGAVGGGVSDDTSALQSAFSARVITGGGILKLGVHKISRALIIDYTGTTERFLKLIQIEGDGPGVSSIFAPNIIGSALQITGSKSTVENHIILRNFRIHGNLFTGSVGLHISRSAYMHCSDLIIEGFATGYNLMDTEQALFENIAVRWNHSGGSISSVPETTDSNSLTFINCTFANNTDSGLQISKGNAVTFINGSVQYNGTTGGGPFNFGVKIVECGTGYGNVVFLGTVWEGNGGDADLFIHNDVNPCVINLCGVSFVKSDLGGVIQTTHTNVLASGTAASQIINVSGSTFRHFNSYIPSVSRPYITKGNPNSAINDLGGNFYQSDLEAPLSQVNRLVNSVRGSVELDLELLNAGSVSYVSVPVEGAEVGDFVMVSFSQSLGGISLTGYVSTSGEVVAVFTNVSGGTIDLPAGVISAAVIPC